MTTLQSGKLPEEAFSFCYAKKRAYTDCLFIDIPRRVTFEEYIEAFYTTPLFKLERSILSLLARRPSTDEEARLLSTGDTSKFSFWTVEKRSSNQILLCDLTNRTRSWLMIDYPIDGQSAVTRLYFGSVVMPKSIRDGHAAFGILFHLLGPFHRMYSRALLKAVERGQSRFSREIGLD